MTAYLFADMDIHDPAGYAEYPPKVWPLIEKHGGRLTHRISHFESLEGDWLPARMIIIEFPDKAAAQAFMDDPEYEPVKQIRFRTAHSRLALGEGE
jgi:uncharacterized protein (DUF1330 family)